MKIEDVLRKYEAQLMELPNVVGVGIGEKNGAPAIKVYVTRKVPESELGVIDTVPKTLEGFATDVEEIGHVSAQGDRRSETDKE